MLDLTFRYEYMSEVFDKYHILGLPFNAVIHHFKGLEKNNEFHNHPWPFISVILSGGYWEKIAKIGVNGKVKYSNIFREPGTTHFVRAEHIHKIVDLPAGECWTLILPLPGNHKSQLWKFDKSGIWSREWDQPEFTPYTPPTPGEAA